MKNCLNRLLTTEETIQSRAGRSRNMSKLSPCRSEGFKAESSEGVETVNVESV